MHIDKGEKSTWSFLAFFLAIVEAFFLRGEELAQWRSVTVFQMQQLLIQVRMFGVREEFLTTRAPRLFDYRMSIMSLITTTEILFQYQKRRHRNVFTAHLHEK